MIKLIDDAFDGHKKLEDFCRKDSFGTMFYSNFLCFDYNLSFVDYWIQLDDCGDIVAAVSYISGEFVVVLSDNSCFDEISEFLNFQSKSTVIFSEKYADRMNIYDISKTSLGDVLKFSGRADTKCDFEIITPDLKEYYSILKMCENNDFQVPKYECFLSNTMHRINKNMNYVYGIKCQDVLVSVAMSGFYTDFASIIEAVATHKDYRNQGYATAVVSRLAEFLYHKTGCVYIFSATADNTRFYELLNFCTCDTWIKYTFE